MEISYLGHSAFKIKGKQGTVVTDPYNSMVGFSMPSVSADLVTISHDHEDHNYLKGVSTTARREKPWVTSACGEYEVAGISVFGYKSFHDEENGLKRGENIVYSIILDGINVVHLGDLGHKLSDDFIEKLGNVGVLLCPVGGEFTLDPEGAVDVIQAIEPSYVIPMHYKTEKHSSVFAKTATLEEFTKTYGVTGEAIDNLSIASAAVLPEQTTLVTLKM